MNPNNQQQDHAGPALTAHVPRSVRNQVNGISSYAYKDNHPKWQQHPEQMSCFRPDGLRFTLFTKADEAFYGGLFHGIHSDRMKEIFFLLCYKEMRKRGLWPAHVAAEQRLSDELYGPYTGTPHTPAAIQ